MATVAAAVAAAYMCAGCGERGRVDDEERGVEWCDGCEGWYHGECLSVQELTLAVTSVCDGDDWNCKKCNPWE